MKPKNVSQEIRRMIGAGISAPEIRRAHGVASSTVSYHRKMMGLSPMIALDNRGRKYDWSAIQREVDAGMTVDGLMAKYGMARMSYTKAVKRGELVPRVLASQLGMLDLLNLFDGKKASSNHRRLIRRALLASGALDRCSHCKADNWFGHRLSLEVHHKDGNPWNNKADNLELVCPNCHSITPNWRGRNKKRVNSGLV